MLIADIFRVWTRIEKFTLSDDNNYTASIKKNEKYNIIHEKKID